MHPCGKIAQDHATFRTQRLMMCYSLADSPANLYQIRYGVHISEHRPWGAPVQTISSVRSLKPELKSEVKLYNYTILSFLPPQHTLTNTYMYIYYSAWCYLAQYWSISAWHHECPKISYMMDFVQIQKLKLKRINVCCPIRLAFFGAFLWQHITIT